MNKYLVKCSGIIHNTLGAVGTLAKNTSNGIGKQFHLAINGGAKEIAQNNLGMKDAEDILKLTSSNAGRRKILIELRKRKASLRPGQKDKTMVGSTSFKFGDGSIKNPSQYLRNQKNSARLSSGLIIGGGIYGGNKILENIDLHRGSDDYSNQFPQYYQ